MLDMRRGRPTLQVWSAESNLVRRIIAVKSETRSQLSLVVEHFGKRQGEIVLVDLAGQASAHVRQRGSRMIWRERFRLMLSREMPGWTIAELSTEPDLEHTLSPAYARALLTRGHHAIAVMGAGPEALEPAKALTFGIIWLDHLRRTRTRETVAQLAVWVPAGAERALALRVRHLRTPVELHTYTSEDVCLRVDAADCGNVDTVLDARASVMPAPAALLQTLATVDGFEAIETPSGAFSLRVRGLEFARAHTQVTASLGGSRPLTNDEAYGLAASLAQFRTPRPADPQNTLYRKQPEAWLEGQVRRHISLIDPSLAHSPVYGQVPAFAAADRGVIDLLTCDHRGRLAVIEIKATSDPELPLQALDYWLRVRFHLERGEFAAAGYFPGTELSNEPPRLLLIAPALEFHETTETLVQSLAPDIEVRRIGLAAHWRERIEVMFQLEGARRPYPA